MVTATASSRQPSHCHSSVREVPSVISDPTSYSTRTVSDVSSIPVCISSISPGAGSNSPSQRTSVLLRTSTLALIESSVAFTTVTPRSSGSSGSSFRHPEVDATPAVSVISRNERRFIYRSSRKWVVNIRSMGEQPSSSTAGTLSSLRHAGPEFAVNVADPQARPRPRARGRRSGSPGRRPGRAPGPPSTRARRRSRTSSGPRTTW